MALEAHLQDLKDILADMENRGLSHTESPWYNFWNTVLVWWTYRLHAQLARVTVAPQLSVVREVIPNHVEVSDDMADLSMTVQADISFVSNATSVVVKLGEEKRIPDFILTLHRLHGVHCRSSPWYFALVEVKPDPTEVGAQSVEIELARPQIAMQARFVFDAHPHLMEVFVFTTSGLTWELVKFRRDKMLQLPVHRLSADADWGSYSEDDLFDEVDWPINSEHIFNRNGTNYNRNFRLALDTILQEHLTRLTV